MIKSRNNNRVFYDKLVYYKRLFVVEKKKKDSSNLEQITMMGVCMQENKFVKNNQFIQGITIDWSKINTDHYLRKIEAIKDVSKVVFDNPVTFFVGENGSGKSTLLEAIAIAYGFNPEGGTKNYLFSTYDSHSELCNAIRIIKGIRRAKSGYFYRAESFYNVATQEREYADVEHPSEKYHEKSHGESFLSLMQNYMCEDGIYIFDEPEAALSPQRQLTLLMEIYKCAEKGAQFIIATHSPILLGIPDADIYSFDAGQIHLCRYEDTDSYIVMEMFINHRKEILYRLLQYQTILSAERGFE